MQLQKRVKTMKKASPGAASDHKTKRRKVLSITPRAETKKMLMEEMKIKLRAVWRTNEAMSNQDWAWKKKRRGGDFYSERWTRCRMIQMNGDENWDDSGLQKSGKLIDCETWRWRKTQIWWQRNEGKPLEENRKVRSPKRLTELRGLCWIADDQTDCNQCDNRWSNEIGNCRPFPNALTNVNRSSIGSNSNESFGIRVLTKKRPEVTEKKCVGRTKRVKGEANARIQFWAFVCVLCVWVYCVPPVHSVNRHHQHHLFHYSPYPYPPWTWWGGGHVCVCGFVLQTYLNTLRLRTRISFAWIGKTVSKNEGKNEIRGKKRREGNFISLQCY